MSKIKNLLFDLGGVVIDIERQRCVDSLTALGMTNADEMIGLYRQSGPFLQLEAGALSPAEFCNAMRATMPEGVTDAQIEQAICNFIIDIPTHRLVALRQLREKYGTYVLSNTNPIMFEGVIDKLFRKEGRQMSDYFDGVTVSYRAKTTSPRPKSLNTPSPQWAFAPKKRFSSTIANATSMPPQNSASPRLSCQREGYLWIF